jgi:DNA polymerase-3 subunit gamma/tau
LISSKEKPQRVFDTIYAHTAVTDQLAKEISRQQLPSAILFHGNRYTARLSTALETARQLSCSQHGDPDCTCSSCTSLRTLTHPYTMTLCCRDHNGELAAMKDLLARKKDAKSRDAFIRTLRKVIGSYNNAFFEAATQAKKQDFTAAHEIDQMLTEMEDLDISSRLAEVLKLSEKSLKRIEKLNKGISKPLPVRHIRMIGTHLRNRGAEHNRIVILEGVDLMNEAAANSLLKILEQPPERCYFILIATSQHSVLPTILSRVRPYHFRDRESFDQQQVIGHIFQDTAGQYPDLDSYFQQKQGIDWRELEKMAEDYLLTAMKQRVTGDLHIQQIITQVAKKGLMDLFMRNLTNLLYSSYENNYITASAAQDILRMASDAKSRSEVYNQGDALMLETLYYRIAQIS